MKGAAALSCRSSPLATHTHRALALDCSLPATDFIEPFGGAASGSSQAIRLPADVTLRHSDGVFG